MSRNLPPLIAALANNLPEETMTEQYLERWMRAMEAALYLCYTVTPSKPRVIPCGKPGHRCDVGDSCAPAPVVLYRESRRMPMLPRTAGH